MGVWQAKPHEVVTNRGVTGRQEVEQMSCVDKQLNIVAGNTQHTMGDKSQTPWTTVRHGTTPRREYISVVVGQVTVQCSNVFEPLGIEIDPLGGTVKVP